MHAREGARFRVIPRALATGGIREDHASEHEA
jgi:hypothetical protein